MLAKLNQEILRYSVNTLKYDLNLTFKKAFTSTDVAIYKIFNASVKIGTENKNGTVKIFQRNGEVFWDIVYTSTNRIMNSASAFKAAIEKGENVFYLGVHNEPFLTNPRPRSVENGIAESHHGIMSAWMRAKYINYNENTFPTVFMLKNPNHKTTQEIANTFLSEKANAMGQNLRTLDYSRITEIEIKELSELMYDGAEVPISMRSEYYIRWNLKRQTLTPK